MRGRTLSPCEALDDAAMDQRGAGSSRAVLRADAAVIDTGTESANGRHPTLAGETRPAADHDPIFDPDPVSDRVADRSRAGGRLLVSHGRHLTRWTRRGARGEGHHLSARPCRWLA